MRGGQKAQSTVEARLRCYLHVTHALAQGHVYSNWHARRCMSKHTDACKCTHRVENISLFYWHCCYCQTLHFSSKGTSKTQTFLPAEGVMIYLSVWQKRAWLNVWMEVRGTLTVIQYTNHTHHSLARSRPKTSTEDNAWVELPVLSVLLKIKI